MDENYGTLEWRQVGAHVVKTTLTKSTDCETEVKLKMHSMTILLIVGTLAMAYMVQGIPYPQNFNDAVKQAQQMSLIPVGAVVDRTSSGIQVAYFKLGENDRVNTDDLRAALEGIPAEVVASLESQVANVGRA